MKLASRRWVSDNSDRDVIVNNINIEVSSESVIEESSHNPGSSATGNIETDSSNNLSPQTSNSSSEAESEPRYFRNLNDIYAESEQVNLEEDELMVMGVNEPANFDQAAKGSEWRKAMKLEMEVVEKNGTWT